MQCKQPLGEMAGKLEFKLVKDQCSVLAGRVVFVVVRDSRMPLAATRRDLPSWQPSVRADYGLTSLFSYRLGTR